MQPEGSVVQNQGVISHSIPQINKQEKISFIGISLSPNNNTESAVAVLDANAKIITLDKLFTVQDLEFFIENFPGKKNSVIMISIPENETMISSKWKYNSRTYQPVNLNSKITNNDEWANRFSNRCSEYIEELKSKGLDVFRYDINNVKKAMGYCTPFKDRTPIDCKALQNTLKIKLNMRELPANMLPVAQLEAILGAYLALCMVIDNKEYQCKKLFTFNNTEVIGF